MALQTNNTSGNIELDRVKCILSTTDLKGNIKYSNRYFSEVSGYSKDELHGSPHNIIRHPDMPKVIFKLMWDRLKNNENVIMIVKNRAKDGNYYWVKTFFEIKYHPKTKEPNGYLAILHAAPKKAIREIEPLYKRLRNIESRYGIHASQDYLIRYLMKDDKTYDEYIHEITQEKNLVIDFLKIMKELAS
ncbi:MAG: PAS domain-containing protein [Sulfurimonas sp.]|nr:PAS domain-containing protein [Sulfurimonas sp.]